MQAIVINIKTGRKFPLPLLYFNRVNVIVGKDFVMMAIGSPTSEI